MSEHTAGDEGARLAWVQAEIDAEEEEVVACYDNVCYNSHGRKHLNGSLLYEMFLEYRAM